MTVLRQHKAPVPNRPIAELYFDAESDRANTETDWRDGNPVQTD